MLEVLAIIPARGGSKGLPLKNLREVGGRTLVAWAVDAAMVSKLVTRVIGSTDDRDIAAEFEQAGAEVLALRPPELSGDTTPDAPVFLYELGVLECLGYKSDVVVNVRPTAPLRTGADIDRALEILRATPRAASVKSVSPVTEHPYKMWTLCEDHLLEPLRPDWHGAHDGDPDVARQLLPHVYRSNGAIDAVRTEALVRSGKFHPGPVAAYAMPASRSLDIDDEGDLLTAGRLLEGVLHERD